MAELKLESELGTMMGLGLNFGGDVKRHASGKIMGCFCAFRVAPSPQGCVLCNRPPLHPDDEENLLLGYAIGTLKEHRPYIDEIRIKYYQQIHESYVVFWSEKGADGLAREFGVWFAVRGWSNGGELVKQQFIGVRSSSMRKIMLVGFDFDDFPGVEVQIEPILNVKDNVDFGIMMKLANRAIQEYNEKEHNVFKYKVLEIEKANYMVGGYEQYFMTVKVLNLTIGTSIETFHINVARRIPDRFEEVLSCNPKGMVPEFSIFGKKKR
ncbi:hypothetical protein H5410_026047 [Solanum commersonii]|uniref:Uncharacterized protein n=1 Tax=Solanum commersonii TaxID=4109 RepID=A0A9J5YUZ1_SOLCO|nr:hypothetical protein H5410_026047 [Solanum commersonii]